jgi:hypothetical protein
MLEAFQAVGAFTILIAGILYIVYKMKQGSS